MHFYNFFLSSLLSRCPLSRKFTFWTYVLWPLCYHACIKMLSSDVYRCQYPRLWQAPPTFSNGQSGAGGFLHPFFFHFKIKFVLANSQFMCWVHAQAIAFCGKSEQSTTNQFLHCSVHSTLYLVYRVEPDGSGPNSNHIQIWFVQRWGLGQGTQNGCIPVCGPGFCGAISPLGGEVFWSR